MRERITGSIIISMIEIAELQLKLGQKDLAMKTVSKLPDLEEHRDSLIVQCYIKLGGIYMKLGYTAEGKDAFRFILLDSFDFLLTVFFPAKHAMEPRILTR